MENLSPVPSPAPKNSGRASASLALGIVSQVVWLLPLIGFPVSIVGLVLGAKSLSSDKPAAAGAGLALSITGLFLTTVNAAIGAYMGATGQIPWLR